MPKYLFEGRYNAEGVKGVAKKGGSGRRDAIMKTFEGLGGKLDSVYFAFGDITSTSFATFRTTKAPPPRRSPSIKAASSRQRSSS
jgi:hypothetical protein